MFHFIQPPALATNVIHTLTEYLRKPPPLTTLRVNILLYSREEAIGLLEKLLSEVIIIIIIY